MEAANEQEKIRLEKEQQAAEEERMRLIEQKAAEAKRIRIKQEQEAAAEAERIKQIENQKEQEAL